MDPKTENSSKGLTPGVSLEKLHKMAEELTLPGRFLLRVLDAALESVTNLLAVVLGSHLARRHFHLMLSALVLFGPVLSSWASKYSIFANSHNYLYRANMVWRGYEVSQDVLILCLCCLLLVEELSVFGPHIVQARPLQGSPGAPLRLVFLLCVALLSVWMLLLLCLLAHFPKFPSQQLGGALGYLGWKGLYQGWYRLTPSWCSPGLPGDGL
ncbi:putative fat storage-inducing transmembrane protein 1 [Scophthalmus maximus]|uniref:Putative fat storage-inducing transmembrane protein 1 n=1 Tax=Scophthalmus maximus TaxID=52904 RepID=A0A2U9CW69_SCOMX|nr:putative fat storage-inducing transmembrane protein 1 [Scophthalmus maximus]